MDTQDAAVPARAARAGRGSRMGQLITEAAEGDDEFWGQDAWKEDAADEGYVSEKEEADVYDSDFNDSEDGADEEDGDDEERPRKRATLRPPGEPKRHKPSAPKAPSGRALETLEGEVAAAATGPVAPSAPKPRAPRAPAPFTTDLLRKSQRSAVLEADLARERMQAEASGRPKQRPRRVQDERPWTQEEMLAEAAQTELFNVADLQRILAMEEETKKRATSAKEVYSGPSVRFRSAGGQETVAFIRGAEEQGFLFAQPPAPTPAAPLPCAVTGRPARYLDPRTRLPYADRGAFQRLRAADEQEQTPSLPFFAAAKRAQRETQHHGALLA